MGDEPRWEFFRGEREFPSLPYADRRFVVVASDIVVEAQRRTAPELAVASEEKWKEALRSLAPEPENQTLLDIGVEARNAFRRARDRKIPLLMISKSEAGQLRFGVGHPMVGVLYVGHPADPLVYVPMADFHRVLFEHKVAEAMHLLVELGATDVEIEHVSGWTSIAEVGINVAGTVNTATGDNVTAETNLKLGRSKGQSGRVIYKMILRPHDEPKIPKDLVWFDHEPLWKEIAHARLKASLASFELDIKYTGDFGVNAKLSAKVGEIGFEIGGSFTEHKETVWRLRGDFGEPHTP
jgi:hypothetical protein